MWAVDAGVCLLECICLVAYYLCNGGRVLVKGDAHVNGIIMYMFSLMGLCMNG